MTLNLHFLKLINFLKYYYLSNFCLGVSLLCSEAGNVPILHLWSHPISPLFKCSYEIIPVNIVMYFKNNEGWYSPCCRLCLKAILCLLLISPVRRYNRLKPRPEVRQTAGGSQQGDQVEQLYTTLSATLFQVVFEILILVHQKAINPFLKSTSHE